MSKTTKKESPVLSLLGKRGADGNKRPVMRAASKYRGVTHHVRTGRYESHVWDQGKQVYLGGWSEEPTAALAYDLAAVKFRGEDAITNHSRAVLQEEFGSMDDVTKESMVQALRTCSKNMNRIDAGATTAVHLEPWELLLSEAVNQDRWQHLGVYTSEGEAARAFDRALVARKGLDAVTGINFALQDYIGTLSTEQVSEGVARGLLPPTLPLDFVPPAAPQPTLQLDALRPVVVARKHGSSGSGSGSGSDASMPDAAAQPSQATYAPVPRKQSRTPRSVMDFEAAAAPQGEHQHEVSIDWLLSLMG